MPCRRHAFSAPSRDPQPSSPGTSSRIPSSAARLVAAALLALALGLAGSPAASAWSPKTQLAVAREAARLAPPDLYRQIDKNERWFQAGVVAPFEDGKPLDHVANPDGSGSLEAAIEREVALAVTMIQELRPFSDVIYQLGVVSHFVADAQNPLNAGHSDPREGDYYADYQRYVESAEPRFSLVFYGFSSGFDSPADVSAMVDRALARSRRYYPLVGQEYARIGYRSGVGRFDDRSTAFGISAVAFSRATTDVAQVLRYIWLEAGGFDPRQGLTDRGGRLLRLPRAEP